MKHVRDQGMKTIAVTDHGTMAGSLICYQEGKSQGVNVIWGCEAYITHQPDDDPNPRTKDNHHLVLLAQTEEGLRNLFHLRFLSGGNFHYKPRIWIEHLRQHNQGLIALSACMGSEIQRVGGWDGEKFTQEDRMREAVVRYHEIFGERYYLELQDNHLPQQDAYNAFLVAIGKELGIPRVVTADAHYTRKEDQETHAFIMAAQLGKTWDEYRSSDEMKYGPYFYLRSAEEMLEAARRCGDESAFWNACEIGKMCREVHPRLNQHAFPRYNQRKDPDYADVMEGVEEELDNTSYFQRKCWVGLRRLGLDSHEEYRRRLEMEIEVISSMKFPDYFLVLAFVLDPRVNGGIKAGPGRGSAGGSLAAYCLGITKVDPVKHALYFERFLNPSRVSLPDVDVDIERDRREEFIQFLVREFGYEHVFQIGAYSTLKGKGAISAAQRVLGYPVALSRRASSLYPAAMQGKEYKLDQALQMSRELAEMSRDGGEGQEMIRWAKALEDRPKSCTIHASGVCITPEPAYKYLPLARDKTGKLVVSDCDMIAVEKYGPVKYDFLGLVTLDALERAVALVQQRHGVSVDVWNLPEGDPKTYELLQQGRTTALFQLESSGMQKLLQQVRPCSLEDISLVLALYRPGPLASPEFQSFLDYKAGRRELSYLHPDLEPFLKPTGGLMVYQETVMNIAVKMAGYTLPEADNLRKIMGKKKPEEMAQQQSKFVDGCVRNGYTQGFADRLFQDIAAFAAYGFNKAHSVAYAMITEATAYLKAHYTAEFMCAMLQVTEDSETLSIYLNECVQWGISVSPPSVNLSQEDFTVISAKEIVYGLRNISALSKGVAQALIKERETGGAFISLHDMLRRVKLNSKQYEALIHAGALDCFGMTRQTLAANVVKQRDYLAAMTKYQEKYEAWCVKHAAWKALHDEAEKIPKKKDRPKIGAEPKPPKDVSFVEFVHMPEYPPLQLFAMEYQYLGAFVSGHPLDNLKDQGVLARNISEAKQLELDSFRTMAVLTAVENKTSRKKKPLITMSFADKTGTLSCVCFGKLAEEYYGKLSPGDVLQADIELEVDASGDTVIYSGIVKSLRVIGDRSSLDIKTYACNLTSANVNKLQREVEAATVMDRRVTLRLHGSDRRTVVVLGPVETNSAVLHTLQSLR